MVALVFVNAGLLISTSLPFLFKSSLKHLLLVKKVYSLCKHKKGQVKVGVLFDGIILI